MTRHTTEDLNKAYRNTFIGVLTDEIIPVYIIEVFNKNGVSMARTNNQDGADITYSFTDPSLVLKYPDLGHVLIDNKLYWLERSAQRQWHKGIRTDLITVIDTTVGRTKSLLSSHPTKFIYKSLSYIYNNKYSNNIFKYYAEKDNKVFYKGIYICDKGKESTVPEHLQYIFDSEWRKYE
jgi:hypothetical protein